MEAGKGQAARPKARDIDFSRERRHSTRRSSEHVASHGLITESLRVP